MSSGTITVIFDEEEEPTVLPRYVFIAGRRIPACVRPGTFLHQTITYRSFADYYDFMERKQQRLLNPNSAQGGGDPRHANIYGIGRQSRRHREHNRKRSRSESFARVRFEYLIIYHVCLWMETNNATVSQTVRYFKNLPLKHSTVHNWKTNGGSKYYKDKIERYGNRKSSNPGMYLYYTVSFIECANE